MKHHKQLQIEPNILKDPKESRRILKNPENFLNIPSNFKLSLILNHWNITNSFKLNQRSQRILKNPEGSQRIPKNRRISFHIGNFRQWLTIETQNQLQMKPGIPKNPAGSRRIPQDPAEITRSWLNRKETKQWTVNEQGERWRSLKRSWKDPNPHNADPNLETLSGSFQDPFQDAFQDGEGGL